MNQKQKDILVEENSDSDDHIEPISNQRPVGMVDPNMQSVEENISFCADALIRPLIQFTKQFVVMSAIIVWFLIVILALSAIVRNHDKKPPELCSPDHTEDIKKIDYLQTFTSASHLVDWSILNSCAMSLVSKNLSRTIPIPDSSMPLVTVSKHDVIQCLQTKFIDYPDNVKIAIELLDRINSSPSLALFYFQMMLEGAIKYYLNNRKDWNEKRANYGEEFVLTKSSMAIFK